MSEGVCVYVPPAKVGGSRGSDRDHAERRPPADSPALIWKSSP